MWATTMRVLSLGLVAIAVLAGAAGVAEHRGFVAGRQVAMGVVDPAKVKLGPVPIRPDWIIEGTPRTLAAEIAHTDDGTTRVYVWQTTAARFHWNYDADEIVQILDGEVFVADMTHGERRLGPGDVAFFPAGAETLWRVPDHLRKIATLRSPVPGPFADMIRWLRAAKHWGRPTAAFAAS